MALNHAQLQNAAYNNPVQQNYPISTTEWGDTAQHDSKRFPDVFSATYPEEEDAIPVFDPAGSHLGSPARKPAKIAAYFGLEFLSRVGSPNGYNRAVTVSLSTIFMQHAFGRPLPDTISAGRKPTGRSFSFIEEHLHEIFIGFRVPGEPNLALKEMDLESYVTSNLYNVPYLMLDRGKVYLAVLHHRLDFPARLLVLLDGITCDPKELSGDRSLNFNDFTNLEAQEHEACRLAYAAAGTLSQEKTVGFVMDPNSVIEIRRKPKRGIQITVSGRRMLCVAVACTLLLPHLLRLLQPIF